MRILLADDHQIVRDGLRALLEREGLKVVATAVNGRDAVEQARATKPDVAVLDLEMPRLNGLDAAREIIREAPQIRVILLTMHTHEHQIIGALRAGVRGYVLKTQAAEDLVHAIRSVTAGEVYLGPGVSTVFVEGYLARENGESDRLAPREREVLQLVAEGKTTKEIATVMGLSVKSAESYRTRIMEKLDLHDTASLVRYAIRTGLIRP